MQCVCVCTSVRVENPVGGETPSNETLAGDDDRCIIERTALLNDTNNDDHLSELDLLSISFSIILHTFTFLYFEFHYYYGIILLYLSFILKREIRLYANRERPREKRKNTRQGGVREAKRTSSKRKAWIVTERAAAGLVIINSEKKD